MRAPRRIKIEAILFGSLRQAQDWAHCGVEEKPGRTLLMLQALTDDVPILRPDDIR